MLVSNFSHSSVLRRREGSADGDRLSIETGLAGDYRRGWLHWRGDRRLEVDVRPTDRAVGVRFEPRVDAVDVKSVQTVGEKA